MKRDIRTVLLALIATASLMGCYSNPSGLRHADAITYPDFSGKHHPGPDLALEQSRRLAEAEVLRYSETDKPVGVTREGFAVSREVMRKRGESGYARSRGWTADQYRFFCEFRSIEIEYHVALLKQRKIFDDVR